MKKGYIVAAVLAVGFLVLGVTAFRTTLTPYVSFDVAKKTAGSVQVMGSLEKGSERYDASRQELAFSMAIAMAWRTSAWLARMVL